MDAGEPYAVITSVQMKLQWFVDNWGSRTMRVFQWMGKFISLPILCLH